MIRRMGLAALAALAFAVPADAKVASLSDNGFVAVFEGEAPATPQEAYDAFLQVGTWWDGSHSFSGDAANMTITAAPDGCWCETLPDGGFVRHMTPIHAAPGQMLVFNGGLGPLQFMGVSGSLLIQFAPTDAGTKVQWQMSVGGYDAGAFKDMSAAVDTVLGQQFARYMAKLTPGAEAPAKPEGGN